MGPGDVNGRSRMRIQGRRRCERVMSIRTCPNPDPRSAIPSSRARSQNFATETRSWLTRTIVLPSSRKRSKVAKHFSWNSSSPTASTSSSRSTSKSTWIAIEYASRTCIPDEKFFSFWSTKRSRPAKSKILVEPLLELALPEAEERAVDPDVVACGELRVEADAELDERRQPAVDSHRSGVLSVDPGEDLEERALAAAVRPDDPEELALVDREAHVVERLLHLVLGAVERVEDVLLERRSPLVRQPEGLRDAPDLDHRTAHTRSANHGSSA